MKTKLLTKTEIRDIQAQAQFRGEKGAFNAPKTDGFGACVGTMAAAVLAAAGASLCDAAGRVTCETDYLAISGATFPPDVSEEELSAFNRETLRPDMTEADERRRYEAIASFFHPERRATA